MTQTQNTDTSFTKLPNPLIEYLTEGVISPFNFAILTVMLHQSDYEQGIWRGSAPRLQATFKHKFSERLFQQVIADLKEQGFISYERFHGQRGDYLVYINNFIPTRGSQKGKLLRPQAIKALSPQQRAVKKSKKASKTQPASPQNDSSITAASPHNGAPYQDTQDIQDKNSLYSENNSLDWVHVCAVKKGDGVSEVSEVSEVKTPVSGEVKEIAVDVTKLVETIASMTDVEREMVMEALKLTPSFNWVDSEVMEIARGMFNDWEEDCQKSIKYGVALPTLEDFVRTELQLRDCSRQDEHLMLGRDYLLKKILLLELQPQTSEKDAELQWLKKQHDAWGVLTAESTAESTLEWTAEVTVATTGGEL